MMSLATSNAHIQPQGQIHKHIYLPHANDEACMIGIRFSICMVCFTLPVTYEEDQEGIKNDATLEINVPVLQYR